jgi:carboxypeptidase T
MKKSLLFLLLFSLPVLLLAQQTIYSRVKIYTDSKTPAQFFATGIEITEVDKKGGWFMAEISQQEINLLTSAGFRCEVIIPDMAEYYTGRFNEKTPVTESDIRLSETWPQPINFSLGSCGGFSTVDEMTAQLDLMRSLYPSLISVKTALSDSISTIEGRTVYYVRISDNPDANESEPEVLYTGMHHAREPIGMQHLLYYMWYLLENYNSDQSIKDLVDNTEMYFVPVFNVDGYLYNISIAPAGGGMWRKNRRYNGVNSQGNPVYGIDLNRNYGYKWGNDDTGSSPNPSSDTYRGTAPFSEPETRMIKYFCESHNFLIALNYHSFANLLLSPWGWTEEQCADSTLFDTYSNLLTRENGYNYGPGSTTIYPTNGGSDDWMYGEQNTKPAILSYTPEVGASSDGFWPIQQRILPLIQQNMFASITAARLALNYGTITDLSSLFMHEYSGYLPFKVKRLGMQDGSFTVSIIPIGNAISDIGGPKTLGGLSLLGEQLDSIPYQLSLFLQDGDTIQYILQLDNGSFVTSDTVTRIYGYPLTVFNDNFENNLQWTGSWVLTPDQYFSPPFSMTDSPAGNYAPGSTKTITMTEEVYLPDELMAIVEFRAKWTLEDDFDYVQLSISTNDGASWTPLNGKFTNPGSEYQIQGSPLYDGKKGDWVRENISLNDYMGKNIKLRFRLKTDSNTEFDGFYFDDFKISTLIDFTSIEESKSEQAFLGNPYPNPADKSFKISYSLPKQSVKNTELTITSPTGTIVSRNRLISESGNIDINVSNLSPGIYFVSLKSTGIQSPVRKLVVR